MECNIVYNVQSSLNKLLSVLLIFETYPRLCFADIPTQTGDEGENLRFESLDVSGIESEISDKIAKNYEEVNCDLFVFLLFFFSSSSFSLFTYLQTLSALGFYEIFRG